MSESVLGWRPFQSIPAAPAWRNGGTHWSNPVRLLRKTMIRMPVRIRSAVITSEKDAEFNHCVLSAGQRVFSSSRINNVPRLCGTRRNSGERSWGQQNQWRTLPGDSRVTNA